MRVILLNGLRILWFIIKHPYIHYTTSGLLHGFLCFSYITLIKFEVEDLPIKPKNIK